MGLERGSPAIWIAFSIFEGGHVLAVGNDKIVHFDRHLLEPPFVPKCPSPFKDRGMVKTLLVSLSEGGYKGVEILRAYTAEAHAIGSWVICVSLLSSRPV